MSYVAQKKNRNYQNPRRKGLKSMQRWGMRLLMKMGKL